MLGLCASSHSRNHHGGHLEWQHQRELSKVALVTALCPVPVRAWLWRHGVPMLASPLLCFLLKMSTMRLIGHHTWIQRGKNRWLDGLHFHDNHKAQIKQVQQMMLELYDECNDLDKVVPDLDPPCHTLPLRT